MAEGGRQVGAAGVAASPGRTGSCGRVGGGGCCRSEAGASSSSNGSMTSSHVARSGSGPARRLDQTPEEPTHAAQHAAQQATDSKEKAADRPS